MYINCKTWFSLRYGTIKTDELVTMAVEQGVNAMALTNINSTADLWDFVDYCQQNNIRPIAGIEIRNEHLFLYILLAQNNNGLLQMHRFLSEHVQAKIPFPVRPVFAGDVYIIYPLGALAPGELKFNEFIGVQTTEVNKLYGVDVSQHPAKFVIRQPVTFQNKTYRNVHRLLRAIDKNIILSKQQLEDVAEPHETFVPQSALI